MVSLPLPDLDYTDELLREYVEFYDGELSRLSAAIEDLIEADGILQNQIDALKNYNNLLWNNVIKHFHPDASIVQGMEIAEDNPLETILDRSRDKTRLVRDNIDKMKAKVEELRAKMKK